MKLTPLGLVGVLIVAIIGFGSAFTNRHTPEEQLQLAITEANKSLPKTLDEITELRTIVYDQATNELRYMHEITDETFEVTPEIREFATESATKAYNSMPAKPRTLVEKAKARVFYVYSHKGTELMKLGVH